MADHIAKQKPEPTQEQEVIQEQLKEQNTAPADAEVFQAEVEEGTLPDESRAEQDQNTVPDDVDVIKTLRQENEVFQSRIKELVAIEAKVCETGQQLQDQQDMNTVLRRRCASLLINEAVTSGARSLSIPVEAAMIYAHRFSCSFDDEGVVEIKPNPTEFLVTQLKCDPLLRNSVARQRGLAAASAAIAGVISLDDADPKQLLGELDRSPARKGQFIARHGTKALLDLAAKTRR